MPGKCKFQDAWMEEEVWKLWIRPGKDCFFAFCSLCKKQIDVSHSGVNDVKSHAKGKKHNQLLTNLTSGKQLTLHSFHKPTKTPDNTSISGPSSCHSLGSVNAIIDDPSCSSVSISGGSNSSSSVLYKLNESANRNTEPRTTISNYLLNDSVTKAEIMWAAYCVTTHTSTRSGAVAVDLFPKMFPDSCIASKLKMHKDKIAYSVTYGLGPYFGKLISDNVRKSPIFALSIDECLNDISQKQQMDVMANYWDDENSRVRTSYLSSSFLEKSTASNLLESLLEVIKEANLPIEKLIQLSTDGPNVNLKLIFDIKQHMKDNLSSEKTILDIGTCSLHIVNGAYKTAHNNLNWKLNQFLRALYRLFKNYPSRRGIYKQVTGSSLFPKKFCAVRWTENSSVIQRCLDMMPYLRNYISEVKQNAPVSENFQIVKSFLNEDHTLEAKLHFSSMIANELEEFLTNFQRNDPLLPFLNQELFLLMKSIGNKFIKKNVMEKITSASQLKKIDLDLFSNLKSLETVDIGYGAKASLKNIKDVNVQRFRLDCKKFLEHMFKKLMEKSPLNKRVVLGCSCINPSIMLSQSLRERRVDVAIEEFIAHNQMSPAQGDLVKRGYLRLCDLDTVKQSLQKFNWKENRLDMFFGDIFTNLNNDAINIQLKTFIKQILVCFHGNAAVERSFSFNKNFLVENLEEKSLIAQRHLHDHIYSLPEGVTSLDVNRKMIIEFRNASSRRNDDLKSKKDAEDEKVNVKKRAAMEIKSLQLKKLKLLEEKSVEISKIDERLKVLKDN